MTRTLVLGLKRALGCIIYELVTYSVAFDNLLSVHEFDRYNLHAEVSKITNVDWSTLLERMLVRNPHSRASTFEVLVKVEVNSFIALYCTVCAACPCRTATVKTSHYERYGYGDSRSTDTDTHTLGAVDTVRFDTVANSVFPL